jgi:hypothetical protein
MAAMTYLAVDIETQAMKYLAVTRKTVGISGKRIPTARHRPVSSSTT